VKIKSTRPFAGPALAAVIACLAAPAPAHATIYMSTNAGGACKPAYGASNKFTFTEFYAHNIGTTDQYLVCNFANFTVGAASQAAQAVTMLRVFVGAGSIAGTAVCTVKMGYWLGGTNTVASQATKSVVLPAFGTSPIEFSATDLPRSLEFQVLSMNCKLPGDAKMGLIQRFEPEPTSGNGWTP